MDKLNTIQKREKLNEVFVDGKKGNGGAYHKYIIKCEKREFFIDFQDGARKLESSITGVLDTDLLEIVRHRLQCFSDGEFRTREGNMALVHIEEALLWLNKRVEDRIERNALGTNEK